MSKPNIVISGLGLVSPVGTGREELSAALAEGIEPQPVVDIPLAAYTTTAKTYVDPTSAMTLVASAMALRDAKIVVTADSGPSVGMSFGTRAGNLTTVEGYIKAMIEQGARLASPLLFIHAYPNTSLSLTAMEFGIKGTSFNFDSGRWCGLQALIQAVDELQGGKMSVMLAGAGDTYTETARPLACEAPFGAAAVVALERADDARTRGARGQAEIVAGALAKDAETALKSLRECGETPADWLLTDCADGEASGKHSTDLLKTVGDCGAAGGLLGVVLATVVMGERRLPAGMGLTDVPRTVVVLSADDSGAAAVLLRRISDS